MWRPAVTPADVPVTTGPRDDAKLAAINAAKAAENPPAPVATVAADATTRTTSTSTSTGTSTSMDDMHSVQPLPSTTSPTTTAAPAKSEKKGTSTSTSTSTSTDDDGFMKEWICLACTMSNHPMHIRCNTCDTPMPGAPTGGGHRVMETQTPSFGSGGGGDWDASIPRSDWSCPACTMFNIGSARKCTVCETPNPAAPKAAPREETKKNGGGSTWSSKQMERYEMVGRQLTDHWRLVRAQFAAYEAKKMEFDLQVAQIDARTNWELALTTAQAADRYLMEERTRLWLLAHQYKPGQTADSPFWKIFEVIKECQVPTQSKDVLPIVGDGKEWVVIGRHAFDVSMATPVDLYVIHSGTDADTSIELVAAGDRKESVLVRQLRGYAHFTADQLMGSYEIEVKRPARLVNQLDSKPFYYHMMAAQMDDTLQQEQTATLMLFYMNSDAEMPPPDLVPLPPGMSELAQVDGNNRTQCSGPHPTSLVLSSNIPRLLDRLPFIHQRSFLPTTLSIRFAPEGVSPPTPSSTTATTAAAPVSSPALPPS